MKFSITLTMKGEPPKLLAFDKQRISIGRTPENDLKIPKGNVSKNHCALFVEDNKIFALDTKSTGGSYVNGRLIVGPHQMRLYDKLYIGDTSIEISLGPNEESKPPSPELLGEARDPNTSPQRLIELGESGNYHIYRALAARVDVPTRVLERLSSCFDEHTVALVAKNPQSSPRALHEAANQFPDGVLENVAFPLYLLEDPKLEGFSVAGLCSILESPQCPGYLLIESAASKDQEILSAVLKNPNTPMQALRQLIRATAHPTIIDKTRWLQKIQHHKSYRASLLQELLDSPEERERALAASFPTTDVERLSQDLSPDVRESLARNPKLTEEAARVLSKDPAEKVRVVLVERQKEKISSMLPRLIQDPSAEVRAALVKHHQLSAAQYEQLVRDPSEKVREAFGYNARSAGFIEGLLRKDLDELQKLFHPEQPIHQKALYLLMRRDLDFLTQLIQKPWLPTPVLRQLKQAAPKELSEIIQRELRERESSK